MSFKLNCTLKKRQKRAGANFSSLNKHKYVWEKQNLAPSLHRECLCHNTQIHTQIIIPQLHMIVWSFFCYKNKSAQWICDLSDASFFPWLHKIICFIFSQTLFKNTVNHQIIFLNLIFWQLILQRHFNICSVICKDLCTEEGSFSYVNFRYFEKFKSCWCFRRYLCFPLPEPSWYYKHPCKLLARHFCFCVWYLVSSQQS